MFEEYLQLLDFFQENKFSELVNITRQGILDKLKSEKFSPLVQPYFLELHVEGEPFDNFSHEPEQISQIKKIINALYHTELALKDVETVNLRDYRTKAQGLFRLGRHTMSHGYKACHLITHLDVDLVEVFAPELASLAPLLKHFHNYAARSSEATAAFLGKINSDELPRTIGMISGIAVDQFHPQGGKTDYPFITQLAATIPSYLDELRGYIQEFSAQASIYEPTVDKQKFDELQQQALLLLNSLEKWESGSFFLSVRALNYIRIIRHTITLSMSILEQVGCVNESSQEAIVEKLNELKYQHLPALFSLTDKMEEYAMLAPGTLSDPLMVEVEKLYQTLINYTGKLVDFSQKDQTILTIEDTRFKAVRLESVYRRIAESHKKLLMLDEAEKVAGQFFSILNKYQQTRLLDLPESTKQRLVNYYKVLQPYFLQIDSRLNNAIVSGLTAQKGWADTFSVRRLDAVSNILLYKAKLQALFDKVKTSHEFNATLRDNLIDSVRARPVELHLEPYSTEGSVFAINENKVLSIPFVSARPGHDYLLPDLDALTLEQVWDLYQYHEFKAAERTSAKRAYHGFYDILTRLNLDILLKDIDVTVKSQLSHLYGTFQPYLVSAFAEDPGIGILDKELVKALAIDESQGNISVARVLGLRESLGAGFLLMEQRLDGRKKQIETQVKRKFHQQLSSESLTQDQQSLARARHVIKHTRYSESLANCRQSLSGWIAVLNDPIKSQLRTSASDIPFPELADIPTRLAQSNQVLIFKGLFNCLYHLQQFAIQLEKLDDDSLETTYTYAVLQAVVHLRDMYRLIKALNADPYLSQTAKEVIQNLQQGYASLAVLTRQYSPEPRENEAVEQPMPHVSISYALNALKILPEHIRAILDDRELSRERELAIHQHTEKVAAEIQGIIDRSNSYFRLLLKAPMMYHLFQELKANLSTFSMVSHAAVLANLGTIQDKLFSDILVATDQWEDNHALKPGMLSGPMKELLDTFYLGLLEPLDLDSPKHVSLVSSMVPIEKRLEAVNQRVVKATFEQGKITFNQSLLSGLLECMGQYNDLMQDPEADGERLAQLKMRMLDKYQQAWPILKAHQERLNYQVDLKYYPLIFNNPALDNFINSAVDETSRIDHIEALARACVCSYDGLHATQQLLINSAAEKTRYLEQLQKAQPNLNAKNIADYTKRIFQKQVDAFTARQFGLIHCEGEFKAKLTDFLIETENEIVNQAKHAEDIKKEVNDLISAKIAQFKQANCADYERLDLIMGAIKRLGDYLDYSDKAIQENRSLFETEDTLRHKRHWLMEFQLLADAQGVPVQQRIAGMQEIMREDGCKDMLLAYHHHDSFSFAWLKQVIVSLFESLGLYTTERLKCYQQLKRSTHDPLPAGQLSAQWGLFSNAPGRAYNLPAVDVPTPQPIIAPSA